MKPCENCGYVRPRKPSGNAGGIARAAKLTPERRKEIASMGGNAKKALAIYAMQAQVIEEGKSDDR